MVLEDGPKCERGSVDCPPRRILSYAYSCNLLFLVKHELQPRCRIVMAHRYARKKTLR